MLSALSHPSSKLPRADGGDVQQVPADDSLHGLEMSDMEVLEEDKVIIAKVFFT